MIITKFLVLLLLCAPVQEYAYGEHSDLKGLKKVFVDTGIDTESRNAIIKDLVKANLGFEIVDEIEAAEIILEFGAGVSTGRVVGRIDDERITLRELRSRTGVGVVVAHARGKDRIVHSFNSTQEAGKPVYVSAFQRKPVTNFVREFVKIYKRANGLK